MMRTHLVFGFLYLGAALTCRLTLQRPNRAALARLDLLRYRHAAHPGPHHDAAQPALGAQGAHPQPDFYPGCFQDLFDVRLPPESLQVMDVLTDK
jgi:hypothetical protein